MNVHDMQELMTREEELCQELQPYVRDHHAFKGHKIIHHPMVIELFFEPKRCGLLNARFQLKKEALAKAEKERDWISYICIHERPYRFDALQYVSLDSGHTLEDTVLADLVGFVWRDSENIWENQSGWEALWANLIEPLNTMDEDDRLAWNALPNHITIYRGIRSRRYNRRGLSWTTDRDKAIWFAKRYTSSKPVVLTGTINKNDMYAHFVGRGESEIVVHYGEVRNIRTEDV